ncbi:MAG: M43 family zinc metalloprotease [Flavobacteriales bacterium]|nr:M43 family zinc metalloprotease [Flavobacteriales bacterium]
MRYFYLVLLLCVPIMVHAQKHSPRCHFDSIHEEHFKSHEYLELLKKEEKAFERFKKQKSRRSNVSYTIPVVVHIVKNESATDMNITDEQIHQQIQVLNASYNATNQDLNQTPEIFQSAIGNPSIEFCLASVDPNGYATNGITRHTTTVSSFSSALDNVKHSAEEGVDAWDPSSYLNIWVAKISSSVLGYSHAPHKTLSASDYPLVHGVVIAYQYFGENEHATFNMGKTLVHEVGHYFNLNHTWGNGSGGCDHDDGVADTPTSEEAYYEIPIHPQVSCGSVDMFMNYMEYVNDSVMVMFSKGQVERMHFALNYYSNRKSLLESEGCGIPDLIAEHQVRHTSSQMGDDGAIYLDIASGVPPYVIAWDTGETKDSLVNLSTGSYSVAITDSLERELNLTFNISYYGNIYDSDNFETYSVDSLLYLQSNSWKAFCVDTFAANIFSVNAPEGLQYLEVNAADGSNKFSRNLGGFKENAFDVSFKMFVPNGKSAAYTIYHKSTCSDLMSAYQVQFNDDGQGFIKAGGEMIAFTFPQHQWFDLNQLIDMDRDLVVLSINDELLADWSLHWTSDSKYGSTELSAIVFEDEVGSSSLVHYLIDDFKFQLATNTDIGILEVDQGLDIRLHPNPTRNELNLSLVDDTGEIYQVSVLNTLGQVLQMMEWDSRSSGEMKLSVESYPDGVYFVGLTSKTQNKILRFVVYR